MKQSDTIAERGFFSPEKINHHFWHLTEDQIFSKFREPFFRELITSKIFRRLKSISFLGAIDYVLPDNPKVKPTSKTRYQHSLGVALLGLQFAKLAELNEQNTKLIVAAGLLHDIGHAPLSHSLEPVFFSQFGLSHHDAGNDIIKGKTLLGNSLNLILSQHGIDIDELLSLIQGNHSSDFNDIFRSPMNIDTFEGILRSRSYMGMSNSGSPSMLVDSFVKLNGQSVIRFDRFWNAKQDIYRYLINGPSGIMGDAIARKYMLENISTFQRSDYFLTERQLFQRHPSLKMILKTAKQLLKSSQKTKIGYKRRLFIINKDVALNFHSDIYKRYLQKKVPDLIEIPQCLTDSLESKQINLFESTCER